MTPPTDGIRRALVRAAPGSDRFLSFDRPVETLVAHDGCEVVALLARAEAAAASGLWAVGFVGYEAAPAFDRALVAHPPAGPAPVAAVSFFRPPRGLDRLSGSGRARLGARSVRWSEGEHAARVAAIRAAIERGDTYQANLVFPVEGEFAGTPEELLAGLMSSGEAPYAALLEADDWALVSLSPELFFERDGARLTMRPMKGTRRRGRFGAEDERIAAELAASEKDRAENLMIVDMVRNDLGRMARPGTVAVERRFELERYPTVWQMTSTVAAESDARLPELFAALFPCASVTGAPKPATMRIIRELETEPRGAYCGAIGFVAPSGHARFSVAIRTLELDRTRGRFRYGVGSGVTWDSDPASEWRECLDKARVLDRPADEFDLFETMRFRPHPGASRGVSLLGFHLERLAASADFFGFALSGERLASSARALVAERTAGLPPGSHRLRLRLSRTGDLALDAEPFARERRSWRLAVDSEPVDSADRLLFHKTTRRERYEAARARAGAGFDEVLLVNERGELTEGTRTNLFLQFGGEWVTPPLEAGLLPGVFRASLLRSGRAVEATLYPRDLARAHRIRLGNALRGWIAVGDGEALR